MQSDRTNPPPVKVNSDFLLDFTAVVLQTESPGKKLQQSVNWIERRWMLKL